MESLFYIICLRHSSNQDYAITWWGPNNSGYTLNLDNAGKYTLDQIIKDERVKDKHNGDDYGIPCEEIDRIAVEREYNYSGWKKGRFVLNDEVFWNAYDIPKSKFYKMPKNTSDKRYFRYIKECANV
jgi:hypothetical protein